VKNRVVCNTPGCYLDAWFEIPDLARVVQTAHLRSNPAHDVDVFEYPAPIHSAPASSLSGGSRALPEKESPHA
jgi:hypothetical protein